MKPEYGKTPIKAEDAKTENEVVQDVEMSEEETRKQLMTYENDILGGLMAAAGFHDNEDEIVPIEILRNGVLYFSFRMHPLDEDEYNKCREENTKYVRNKSVGVRVPERTNSSRYRSCLIYEATVAEDREKLWDNKSAWKKLNVLSGPDLISKVLKAGEKDEICDKLDEISGYKATEVETIKN